MKMETHNILYLSVLVFVISCLADAKPKKTSYGAKDKFLKSDENDKYVKNYKYIEKDGVPNNKEMSKEALSRVKRMDETLASLSRVKRLDDLSNPLSRLKRLYTDDEKIDKDIILTRVKRLDDKAKKNKSKRKNAHLKIKKQEEKKKSLSREKRLSKGRFSKYPMQENKYEKGHQPGFHHEQHRQDKQPKK